MPADRPRPAVQSYEGGTYSFALPPELTAALKELSRREGVTLFMTLLAAYQTLLHRYTGQQDICVGTPIAGRGKLEAEGLIGFFVNTLVMRGRMIGDPRFSELVAATREVCLGAYAHQDVPFEKLVEEIDPERDLGYAPLFQVMLILQNASQGGLELPGLRLSHVGREDKTAKFDLNLAMSDNGTALFGILEYSTSLFDLATIRRMAQHFENLLNSIVRDPNLRLSELDLLGDEERHRLLVQWNDTHVQYPAGQCIHQLFEAQVAQNPEAIALVSEDQRLTYRELNRRANQLAHHLIALGVGPEILVGVLAERSVEMIVGLLATLKAGGAYVPLDPQYPVERLSFTLADADVAVLLTQQSLLGLLPPSKAQVVCLDQKSEFAQLPSQNPVSTSIPANLAYTIYTSGSTGRPKGVAITHHSAAILLHWASETFGADTLTNVLASTSICFDLSVFEIFVPLSYGTTVVLAENALALPTLAVANDVTMINTVPSAMRELVRMEAIGPSVRVVNLGGEALSRNLVEDVYRCSAVKEVWNGYGPSEDTTFTTACLVPQGPDQKVTIGGPLPNTEIYIVDQRLQPVPVGVAGELCISGEGLARGYLNRPSLTAERFVPNPFGARTGARLYKTGDLARYLANGEIEYLGRSDYQVKIRGFRIELGEIETALEKHETVREAVVMVREEAEGDKRLVAYVVPAEDRTLVSSELRLHLRTYVPEFMLPSVFVSLPELPMTPNGKVDRRALPAPESPRGEPDATFATPRTPVAEVLAGIWAEVLGIEQVPLDESFFELGGHSLLATQVMTRVREAFGIELPLRRLFEGPTVNNLAIAVEVALRSAQGVTAPPLVRVSREQDLPLSFAQQRLWFLDQLEPGSSFHNISTAVRIAGRLDVAAFEQTLTEIVGRHEAWRTTFQIANGQPVQIIASAAPVSLPLVELSDLGEAERDAQIERYAEQEAQRPFDLAAGPLVRFTLLRLSAEDHVALFTVHHIISDGWSLGVLVREVAVLYEAFVNGRPSPLPELPIQYADYSHWQRTWLRDEELERQLAYWKQHLAGAPLLLELPTDKPRPSVPSFRGAGHTIMLGRELTDAVKTLCRRENATLFMTLLAAFQTLLHRFSGQDHIIVSTGIAGRTRIETEGLLGFFVNTLLLRADFSGAPSFRELLSQVREATLGAYAHQDLPFEKLVEELQPDRTLSHLPLTQVMFVLQNAPQKALEIPGLTFTQLSGKNQSASFDLILFMEERPQGLAATFHYSTDLFELQTIKLIAGYFESLLKSIVTNADEEVASLYLTSEEESAETVAV